MKNIIKNYKSTLILLLSIVIGAIVGLIAGEKASVLAPFGDLFINMLLVIIVPLIFITITTSIGKISSGKRLGKILINIVIVFIITSLVSVGVGLLFSATPLVSGKNATSIIAALGNETATEEKLNLLERTVQTISTNDFVNLLSKSNIIPLIMISLLVGLAIAKSKEDGKPFLNLLESANSVMQKLIELIMLYAPIGIACYFASFIGQFGASIAVGYVKTFVLYLIASLFIYFVMYSIYAFLASGKQGFINYWKNIIPSTLTAVSTCSSAACIPINTQCAKNIGVSDEIATTTIPLGTSFHKDGSIVWSVFKIMFLVYLFNLDISLIKIIGVALVATVLVTAVPIGGGTISEMFIISLIGAPINALPILTIIATIIDAPATVLNVVGDSASSMLVSRITDGKHWLKKESTKKIKRKTKENKRY